jgi:hypothetical protein
MKCRLVALATVLLLSSAINASASSVVIWGEAPFGLDRNAMNSFYNGLPGHNSTLIAQGVALDTVNLTGISLLWATQPADAYTAAELTTMANFLAGGGRIAFMGEHGTIAPAENNRINAALAFLGSTITIQNVIHDSGFRSASVGDGQILAHPLTAGVNTYEYAAYAPLTVAGTAQVLMIGEEQPSVMMAYQNIGPGSIFLITDQNVWDNDPLWGSFDNERMFENLLIGQTGAPPPPPVGTVPEPGSLVLLGSGVVGLLYSRSRRTRRQ